MRGTPRQPQRLPRDFAWLAALALLGLALLAYAPALRADWMWDDDANVTACAPVLAPDGLSRIWLDPHAIQQYYPMVHTTFWLEHRLWGSNPAGYHAVNVVLHALDAMLLWRLLIELGFTGWAAWLAGLLFVLHPVHVESVAWVTERKNTLSFAFAAWSAIAWCRWAGLVEARRAETGRPLGLAIAAFAFLLALLSKSVTMTLPVALAAIAWWKRGRLDRRAWSLAPMALAAALFGLLTVHLESQNVGTARLGLHLDAPQRVLLAGHALWFYAGKLALPSNLDFIYPRFPLDPRAATPWLFPLAAIALLATLWAARSRIGRGPLAAALAWGAMLAPMLGFVDIFFFRYGDVSDHFQYHASAVPLALAGLGLARAGHALDLRWKRAGVVLLAMVASVLGGLTFERAMVFHDSTTLWSDTLRRNPQAWIAWNNLGRITLDAGHPEHAEPMLRRAIAIDDQQHEPWNNLGICLMDRGQARQAIAAFERAIALHPTGLSERENLGRAWLVEGDFERAVAVLRGVVRHPDHGADAEVDLVEALLRGGHVGEAEAAARDALQRFPDDTRFHLLLAAGLRRRGALAAAASTLEAAAALSQRHDPVVLDALGMTLAASGRFGDAARIEEEALALGAGPRAEAVLRPHLESFRRGELPR